MSTLATAMTHTDLQRMGDQALPYLYEEIFGSADGRAGRLARRRFRMLKGLDGLLERILDAGERVYFATWGIDYAFWEQCFLGLWAWLINRRAVVVTDRRVLLLQVDSRLRPLDLAFQIEHGAVARVKRSALGPLVLGLRDGRKVTLTGIPRRDRRRVQELVERFGGRAGASGRTGRQNLCPHCGTAVAGRPAGCPHCHRPFKTSRKAALLSLAFPGLGDLYLGLRSLAALEMLGAGVVWLAVFGALLAPGDHEPLTPLELGMAGVMLAMVLHGPDALVTRHTARKGLYPEKG